ncbi:hypothetical protein QFC21_005515 [Naganishia friedmannii]|uniref:Uncharacterized protein n=1 Tax=Naganishia friedmannii TaxID=89922 RepID=A0ACC2V9A2_9TREE|nr:hypothetical protein QFC21_005515 [Naganishia friedmannii]
MSSRLPQAPEEDIHPVAERDELEPSEDSQRAPRKKQKFTRTRGVGCETCRRRKKKCDGIDTIFKTCLGCRKNGLLCLPWGSEHPHLPAGTSQNGANSRDESETVNDRGRRIEVQQGMGSSVATIGSGMHIINASSRGPSTVRNGGLGTYIPSQLATEHTQQPMGFPAPSPPFQQTDPDFDPQFINPVIDEPMSPNTAAIWMSLIQFTEPTVPIPQAMEYTTEQAVFGMQGEQSKGYPRGGYSAVGAAGHATRSPLLSSSDTRPPTSQIPVDEILTMEYALDPRTDLRKHPHTQQLLDLYLSIADCWLPTFPPGSNNPIRTAVAGLHDSPASVCVRSALASAYIRCMKPIGAGNGATSSASGKAKGKQRVENAGTDDELPKPLSVDLEKLFVDTAITSISANPPDLSLSNKLWCIIDLQLYYFTHSSAFQGMEIMKMAEDIIHQEFGESPELVMSLLYRQQTFGARIYALGNISACLLDRGRRCVFDLIGKNDDDPHIPASMALGAYDSNWVSGNAWLGMPMSIGVQLASIVELVADIKDAEKQYGVERRSNGKKKGQVPSWMDEAFQDRGFAIEQRIKRKDFTRSVGGNAGGVGEPPIGVVLGDLWKATALTVLYQSVFSYGPLHPHLRATFAEMRRTLNITFEHSYRSPPPFHLPHLFGHISCPVFFAGTLAISVEDRQWARRMVERLGPEQAWRDNRAMLEGLWREMDDRGWPVDWYEYMVEHELWVGFY